MSRRRSLEASAAAASVVAILIGGRTPAAWATTSVVPSVGADAVWTDNLYLAPPGEETAGEIYDVQPGLQLEHDSAREHASLNYTLYALFFSGDNHDFLQDGKLVSMTQVVPNWFELDLSGGRTQGAANPALPANSQFLLPVSNLANYTTGTVTPLLKHDFREVEVKASYTRGFSDSGLVDGQASPVGVAAVGSSYRSNERDAAFSLSSIDKNARLTWRADYQRDQADYESPYFLRYVDEQANGELGLLTISTLRLIARGGKESNPQNGLSQGGLQAPYWAGGFDWSQGPHNELRFLLGHRYFGRTYEASARRESQLLKLEASYTEEPTTQDALLMQQPFAAAPIVQVPGALGFTRLSPDVFLSKTLSGAASITGRLTEIGLSVESDQRTYYAFGNPGVSGGFVNATAGYTDRQRSAALYANRQLGPLMRLALSATYGKDDLREGAATGYSTQIYSAVLTRNLGQRSSVYLRVERYEESGGSVEYTSNSVGLGFKVLFGHGSATQGFGNGMGYGPE